MQCVTHKNIIMKKIFLKLMVDAKIQYTNTSNQVPENQIFDHLITTKLYKNKNKN